MKQIKIYLFALLAVLSMAACGSSDDGDSSVINTNKNEVTTDKAVTRLEFPKLKGGNSIIRVYRDGNSKQYDPDNVNYSVEWDCDKKSQRWSCYILTNKNSGNFIHGCHVYPCHFVVGHGFFPCVRFAVERDAVYFEAFVMEHLVGLHEEGELHHAGTAPRCPEIEQDVFAFAYHRRERYFVAFGIGQDDIYVFAAHVGVLLGFGVFPDFTRELGLPDGR